MIRDNDAAKPSHEEKEGSIVDAIFAVTVDAEGISTEGRDPFNGALQAVLARRMRDLLEEGRESSKAA